MLFLAGPHTVAESQPASLWQHNSSVMTLYASGHAREFRYHEPRIGMQQEDVAPGTLLFSGIKSGNTYSGTAYIFSRRCGVHPYQVRGTTADDGREITMLGTAPAVFDASCRPVAYREDVLVFAFLQAIGAPAPVVVGSVDRDHTAAQDELQRLRAEREHEERRLAELRAFSNQRAACSRYDVQACDAALRSPHASVREMADLTRWRNAAEKFSSNRPACRTGSVAACDAALLSPALRDEDHALIKQWRSAASPITRASAAVSFYTDMVAAAAVDVLSMLRNLPTSTHLAGGMAAVLALALAGITLRNRRATLPGQAGAATAPQTKADGADAATESPRQEHATQPGGTQGLFSMFASSAAASPNSTSPSPPISKPQSAPPLVRDTPGAIAALELAYAYLDEVREAPRPAFDDTDTRKQHLNTLALAAKQLDAAQNLDPDAILEGQDDRDILYRFSIDELMAEALLLEGLTHQTYDIKRAIPALRRATTLNPSNPTAFYVLGLTQAANRNKAEAVAAFQRAVALDPKNIAYRKELNRVESLSAAEIAGYKATRAGERLFDAGIKTANAGIATWNIFAVLWNIVTFPLRLVFGIFRFLGLAGFR